MYSDLTSNPLKYAPSWDSETLDDRLSSLHSPLPKVAWLYEKPDTSTFRYRVYNMVEGLRCESPPRVAASWFTHAEIPALAPHIVRLDALVLARMRYDAEVASLISLAKAHRVPVIFDSDDLVFDTRYVHLLIDALDLDTAAVDTWNSWYAYCGRIEATARLCDAGIATNDFLADRMRDVVDGPVRVVPNFLNRDQQQISDLLLSTKRERDFISDGRICIGYFSGSPSHNRDFAIAAPALARLLERDPSLRLRVVGFLDSLGPVAVHSDRIERVALQDWVNLQRLIAEVEINIAPLQENVFTNCKSELKFFEAAAVGTWTIASPTIPFRQALAIPERGRLARADEWDRALAEAVTLARSTFRYSVLAEANASAVRAAYGWDRFGDRIRLATMQCD